jgi:hypothetical protein
MAPKSHNCGAIGLFRLYPLAHQQCEVGLDITSCVFRIPGFAASKWQQLIGWQQRLETLSCSGLSERHG